MLTPTRARVAGLLVIGLIYLAYFFYLERLWFTPKWDEPHFWETTLAFAESPIPSYSTLADYDELNTPLAFWIFGLLHYYFHAGLVAGRWLTFLLSLSMVVLLVFAHRSAYRSLAAAFGLLSYPYFLQLTGLLYSDIVAAFLVLLGTLLYRRDRHGLAAFTFALAIACRQFAIAVPAALCVYEFQRSYPSSGLRLRWRWLAPLLATGSLAIWVAIFDGVTPPTALHHSTLPVPKVQLHLWRLDLSSSLYALAGVGVYFVFPEWVLFHRRRPNLAAPIGPILAVLSLLLFLWPPLESHGLLNKVASLLPAFPLVWLLFLLPALLVTLRFWRAGLASWLVLMHLAVMLKAFPWDKYLLTLLVALWYLRAAAPHLLGVPSTSSTSPLADASSAPPPA